MQSPKIVAVKQIVVGDHPIPNDWTVADYYTQRNIIDEADILVQANVLGNKKRKYQPMYQMIIDSGKPWIVAESAVFRKNMCSYPHSDAYHRYSWFSYYWDQAEYCNADSPPDRWETVQREQQIEIKPWKKDGDYILVVLQRPGDSSLKPLLDLHGDYETFLTHTLNSIRANTDRSIVIRLHPLRQDRQIEILKKIEHTLGDVEYSGIMLGQTPGHVLEGGDSLLKDFANAWAVVGFNSNALTESVCEGIPTFSLCSSSMAWPVSNHDLAQLDNPDRTIMRMQWLWDLAYCQWKESEVAGGAMWEHVGQLWPKIKQTRLDRPDWQEVLQRREDYYQQHYIQHWANYYARNKKILNKHLQRKMKGK